MRAVTFDVSIPRFILAKTLGRVSDSAIYGGLSGVKMEDRPRLDLPGDRWVRIEVIKAGICGSDIGNLSYSSSPAMEPFGSFPAVLGHEILGRVTEVGKGVAGVEPGQRVTVDPFLSCEVRGHTGEQVCGSCSAGLHSTCENAGEDGVTLIDGKPMAPGTTQGYNRSMPGGWADELIAHEVQVFPIREELVDNAGVLIEPLAVGMHAALNAPPAHSKEPVLVIGSGPIALATVWAIRASGFEGEIYSQTKRAHEAALARAFGASQIIAPGDQAREALIGTGARAYMPLVGDEVYAGGGFPLIYDCVGSKQTLSQAMRYATPRGRIVMLGCAHEIPKLDLTFIWAHELDIKGFVGYGREHFRGRDQHTFDITQDLLVESGVPVQDMVTHVYPLGQYGDALKAAGNRRRTGSVKVLLDPAEG